MPSPLSTNHRCPVRDAALCMAMAACVIGCGGVSDAADGIATGFVCGLAGCKPSDGLATSDIAPDYVVASSGAEVRVSAGFRTGGGLLQDVQLTTDSLAVSTDAGPTIGFASDSTKLAWSAVFPAASTSRIYRIAFTRRDGSVLTSTATLPAAFALLSPTAALPLDRRSAPVPITVSAPPGEPLAVHYGGTCGAAQVSGTLALPAPTAAAGGSTYMLDPDALYRAVLPALSPDPGRCDLGVTLARVQAGTVDPAFRADGVSSGRFERTIPVVFDTRP